MKIKINRDIAIKAFEGLVKQKNDCIATEVWLSNLLRKAGSESSAVTNFFQWFIIEEVEDLLFDKAFNSNWIDIQIKTNRESISIVVSVIDNFEVKFEIPALIMTHGSIVADAHLFASIISKFANENIEIEKTDDYLILTDSNTFFEIPVKNNEFDIPSVEQQMDFVLLAKELKMIDNKISFSAYDGKCKAKGLLFDVENGYLNVVSTDGYRLSLYQTIMPGITDICFSIPVEAVRSAVNLINENIKKIVFYVGKQYVAFSVGIYSFTIKRMSVEFDYKFYLNKYSNLKSCLYIKTRKLIDAMERVSLVANMKENKHKHTIITVDNNILKVSYMGEAGNSTEEIVLETNSENIKIGLNSRYLIEALRVIDTDEIKIEFSEPLESILIKPVGGDGFIYLIMPVRI